jgi:hypothetical protein
MVNGGAPRPTLVCSLLLVVLTGMLALRMYAEAPPPNGKTFQPDTITFNNGDQLTGKLVKVLAGVVTFHSDVLGDVTVPLAKVKAMHAAEAFAVVQKDQHVTIRTAVKDIPVGAIALENGNIQVGVEGSARSLPAKGADYMVDAAGFQRELHGDSDFRYGWNGTATVGASLVTGTNSAQTYTGSVAFVRAIPTVLWLPSYSKTTVNLSATYGLAHDAEVVSNGNVFQAASVSKTDINHGDAEYDRYLGSQLYGRHLFALVNASADHNFGNGVQLQQAYGAGLGWTLVKSSKDIFDLKASLQYEQQVFYNGLYSGLGTPTENLVGAALSENWNRAFGHAIKFNEHVTLSPTFNLVQAYSAVASSSLVFPVYKKLSFSLSSTDNYLGDPPQGYLRNSFQFTAGMTYTLK